MQMNLSRSISLSFIVMAGMEGGGLKLVNSILGENNVVTYGGGVRD